MSDDVDSNAETETRSANLPDAGSRIWQTLRPPLEQAALNLRVWLPVLSTPDMKGRQVKYRARESRVGLKWQLALPKQCWQCGKPDGLERRETNQSLRCFDNPVAIVSGSFGSALLLLLVWVFAPWEWPLKLALLLMIGGSVLLFIKSWKERVRIAIWTCAEHAAELPSCNFAVNEDELHLFVPSESLAETARTQLQAARRGETAAPTPKAKSEASGSAPSNNQAAPSSAPAPRTELPPLKLDGDAAEAPASAGIPPLPGSPTGSRTELPPLKLDGDKAETRESADTPPPSGSPPGLGSELPPLKLAGDDDEPASS
ncbi:MAG TPA: hypothetical protein VHC19_28355 [Pirellulales bacterium]|nr:hypothetical protein [Pirellulales bacterium]